MAGLGLLCLVTLSRLSPRAGNCILAGAVAAFLKIFALGGLFPGPLIGILGEAVVIELLLDLGGTRLWTSMSAGACVFAMTPLQMALTVRIVAGPQPIAALAGLLGRVTAVMGLPPVSIRTMLGVAALSAAVVGCGAGWWAWRISSRVLRRLGGAP